MSREEELRREGWEKRTTYDEPRLSELVEMYEEMGFEVRLEPFEPEDDSGCQECMKLDKNRYKTIFVRKKETTNL